MHLHVLGNVLVFTMVTKPVEHSPPPVLFSTPVCDGFYYEIFF